MLQYSLSTVYMTILTSNLMLIFIACLFRSNKVMVNLGYRLLAVFVCITFLRFLLPFEFPFTTNILLPRYISFVIVLFRHPFFFIGSYGVTLWTFMEIAWIIGSIIFGVRYLKETRVIKQYVLLMGKRPAEFDKYMSILNTICNNCGKKNNFHILEIEDLDSPKIYGIRNPYILLPANLNFSEEDIYYVLNHEATHHFHHDILLKCTIRILSIVYWWNPACHYLYKKANLLLEMRIDDTVAKDHTEASKYLNCLILIAENMQKQNNPPIAMTLSFTQSNRKDLTKRFEMLTNRKEPRNYVLNTILFVAIILLYVLSYFYTFEAHYKPDYVLENTISITADSSYFIDNEDGTYDLYYSGIYFETVSSLEFYRDNIPIYTQEEFEQLTSN